MCGDACPEKIAGMVWFSVHGFLAQFKDSLGFPNLGMAAFDGDVSGVVDFYEKQWLRAPRPARRRRRRAEGRSCRTRRAARADR